MGIFGALFGNVDKMDNEKANTRLDGILFPGETVELAFALIRDTIVFTSHRLIVTNVQGVGKKKSYHCLPYRSISRYEFETTGNLDLDSELDIYISGQTDPALSFTFSGTQNILEVQQALAMAICQ